MGRGHLFLSPCSGGLSSALARWYIRNTELPIIATSRKDESDVMKILNVHSDKVKGRFNLIKMDILDDKSLENAREQVSDIMKDDGYIRLGIISPGILNITEKSTSQISRDDANKTFAVNTIGPLMVIKYFSDFLPTHRASSPLSGKTDIEKLENLPDICVWAMVTAKMGSISDNSLGGWYAYRGSKAALNQIVRSLNKHLSYQQDPSRQRSIAVALHPGTVKTELSKDFWTTSEKQGKLISPDQSAKKLGKLLSGVTVKDGGQFLSYDGKILPW